MSGPPAPELLRRLDALSDRIAEETASLKRQAAVLEAQAAALAARTDHVMDRLDALAALLREAVARRRLGMGALPPGAAP